MAVTITVSVPVVIWLMKIHPCPVLSGFGCYPMCFGLPLQFTFGSHLLFEIDRNELPIGISMLLLLDDPGARSSTLDEFL